MWREEEVRGFARANHGLVDRAAVLDVGGSDAVIKRRLKNGRWTAVAPGVYDLNVTDREWRGEVRAATLAAGPHALASHRTAALLWGLDGVRGRMIELTVPFSKEPMPPGIIVHRTRRLLPGTIVDGIPVTTPARTLLDLARFLPYRTLEKAVSSALRLGLATADEVARVLKEQGGRGVTGTRKLRFVLAQVVDELTGSPAEVDMDQIIRDAPVPSPKKQHQVPLPDGSNAYPDFAWPDRMKIVEVDGFEAHGQPDAFDHDLIRQNKLMELGWEIRRFSARKVRRDPEGVRAEIIRFILG
jgi:very-short-patch-repair endonuclease